MEIFILFLFFFHHIFPLYSKPTMPETLRERRGLKAQMNWDHVSSHSIV